MDVKGKNGLEPIEGLLWVFFLIDDMKEVLHEVVRLIGYRYVFLVLSHELYQVLCHYLSHLTQFEKYFIIFEVLEILNQGFE